MRKNRLLPPVIFLAAIILFSWVGEARSVHRQARKTTDGFFSGVWLEESRRTAPAAAEHLSACARAATGIASVLAPEENGALNAARVKLLDALDRKDGQAACDAFRVLTDTVENSVTLTNTDDELYQTYLDTYRNAAAAITRCGYEESAQRYEQKVLGAFPTRYITRFLPGTDVPHFDDAVVSPKGATG